MDAGELPVSQLVVAARAGDGGAFERLYQRFHAVTHAVVLARVPAGDAADVVQDVFVHAWKKLGALREPEAFPGWLLSIARRRATDHARRARPFARERDLAVDPPPRAEALSALRAIRELPEAYRETLVMRLVEGMSGPEIALRTGMTPDSVRVHLHRGIKLLRARLGPER
jgi:RNA polymerase sigma-70 factor (ECF subfamily)